MITLIGHGYIGSAIGRELLKQGVHFKWSTHKLQNYIDTDLIINAAGYTGARNVDDCEAHKLDCLRGNVLFPLNLHEHYSAPILHITSGCVYDGLSQDWTEEDRPNFEGSYYSRCKAIAQRAIEPILGNGYMLRVRMPFDASMHPKNLLTKLRNYPLLINQIQSISFVDDIAKCVCEFINNPPTPGVYNCVNGAISIRHIAEIMGWHKEWMTREEFASIIKAPRSECMLSTEKLSRVFQMRPVEDALWLCQRVSAGA